MGDERGRLVLLAAEVTFGVLLIRALRGPRSALIVVLPFTLIFYLDMARVAYGTLPGWADALDTTVLLAQPTLALGVAARFTPVPRLLSAAVVLSYVMVVTPLVLPPRPLLGAARDPAILYLATVAIVTAVLFHRAARRCAGTHRRRLLVAAGAAVASGLVLLPRDPAPGLAIALVSAFGYLFAAPSLGGTADPVGYTVAHGLRAGRADFAISLSGTGDRATSTRGALMQPVPSAATATPTGPAATSPGPTVGAGPLIGAGPTGTGGDTRPASNTGDTRPAVTGGDVVPADVVPADVDPADVDPADRAPAAEVAPERPPLEIKLRSAVPPAGTLDGPGVRPGPARSRLGLGRRAR